MNYKIEKPKTDLSNLMRFKSVGYGQIFAIGDIYSQDDMVLFVKIRPLKNGEIIYNAICLEDGEPLKVENERAVSVYAAPIVFDVNKFVIRGAK